MSIPSKFELPFYQQPRFRRLTINDGLPHSTVSSVLQDQQGFMWFGTQNGLSRFDGYKFQVFTHEYDNLNSLNNNNIFSLIESQDGLLWIGTDLGGINVYDPYSGRFGFHKSVAEDPNTLINNSVWSLLEDSKGMIWAGTRAGLSRYGRSEDSFFRYHPDSENPEAFAGSVVYRIYEDRTGTLWFGTNAGLTRYHRDTNNFTTFAHDPQNPQSISFNHVWTMLEDHQGNFWVGTRGGGLNLFDRDQGTFEAYRHNPKDPTTISDDKLWALFEDRSGNLWITTETGGLNRFEPHNQRFVSYQHNPNDPYSLSSNDVFWMCEDRSGVLWITSRYGGVNLLSPACQRFQHYRNIPGNINTLRENNIYAILAEANDILWLGSFGGGLHRLDQKTGEMQVYSCDPNNPNSLSNNKIYDIYRDSKGVMWLATSGGGLNRFEPETGEFTVYRYHVNQPEVIGSNFLTTIAEAGKDQLWIGTLGYGLNLFDSVKGRMIKEFTHEPENPHSLSEDTIYDLEVDSIGNVWIATARGGLNRLDIQTGQIQRYQNIPDDRNSLFNDTVHALYLDEANQILWVGTAGSLSRFDLAALTWEHFTTKDGLPNDMIAAVQLDQSGRIWVSTNRGISCFDPLTKKFQNFSVLDGLQSNQFNIASSNRGLKGELYFGGPNGLTEFSPQQIIESQYEPPVLLTGLELFNKPVNVGSEILPVPIENLETLVLKHDQSVMTFEFAALNYQLSGKNLYRYKMEGFDQEWSPPRSNRRATYTNLKRGRYTFIVQACNHDGHWSRNQLELKIEILPAWWRTWWFRAGMISLGTLAVGGAFYLRMRQNRIITLQLEQRVEERTHQLTTEVSRRQKAEEELLQINDTLQSKLLTITSLQHQLRQQAIRDPLTGLYNRRYLDEFIAREFPRAQRKKYQVAFLLLDLDNFKTINDTYGHHAGDEALKSVADILKKYSRRSDFACRYGGEEFLVIMPETGFEKARRKAENLRSLIENRVIRYEEQPVYLTTSVGIAIYPDHSSDSESLLKQVDAALYQAKLDGRNRVVMFG